ncbi:unnamed protein product, partial [Lepidochelys olivacea]
MAWAPLLLTLLTHCSASSAQPVLTQPPSMAASPGQTGKISCSMGSGVTVQSYPQTWLQQTPGSPPQHLFSYYSRMSRGSGVPERFSGSKESSSNVWYLSQEFVGSGAGGVRPFHLFLAGSVSSELPNSQSESESQPLGSSWF